MVMEINPRRKPKQEINDPSEQSSALRPTGEVESPALLPARMEPSEREKNEEHLNELRQSHKHDWESKQKEDDAKRLKQEDAHERELAGLKRSHENRIEQLKKQLARVRATYDGTPYGTAYGTTYAGDESQYHRSIRLPATQPELYLDHMAARSNFQYPGYGISQESRSNHFLGVRGPTREFKEHTHLGQYPKPIYEPIQEPIGELFRRKLNREVDERRRPRETDQVFQNPDEMKDATIHMKLDAVQDLEQQLETYNRLGRLGRFAEARQLLYSTLAQHTDSPLHFWLLVSYQQRWEKCMKKMRWTTSKLS